MESMLLVRPAPEYAEAIADYRRECLDTGSRMDGCGPLRRMEDPMDWIRYSMLFWQLTAGISATPSARRNGGKAMPLRCCGIPCHFAGRSAWKKF